MVRPARLMLPLLAVALGCRSATKPSDGATKTERDSSGSSGIDVVEGSTMATNAPQRRPCECHCPEKDDLRKPWCDIDCPHEEERELCDEIADISRADLDDLFFEYSWRLFTALNHPELARDDGPSWLGWYSPSAQTAERGVDYMGLLSAVAGDRPPCEVPRREILRELETVTWYDPQPRALPSPAHSPLFYGPDGAETVSYESRVNKPSEGRVKLGMESCDKQVALAGNNELPIRNWGRRSFHVLPPIHLKAAWVRIEDPQECEREFICKTTGTGEHRRHDGLVALHVVSKTAHTKNFWVWATFEHVRAVATADPSKRIFHDPQCRSSKCTNACPAPGRPTHLQRLEHDFEGAEEYRAAVAKFNDSFHELLEGEGLRVLSNYILIGVQRPLHDDTEIIREWPPMLASSVIEWDRQQSSCIGCHSRALNWQRPGEGGPPQLGWNPFKQELPPWRTPQSDKFWGFAKVQCP